MKLRVALQLLCCASAMAGPAGMAASRSSGSDELVDRLSEDVTKIMHWFAHPRSFLQLDVGGSKTKGAHTHKHTLSPEDAEAAMAQLPAGKAGMPAMLGLLNAMYGNWKEKIGDANRKEKEQKVAFDNNMKDLEAKKAVHKEDAGWVQTMERVEKYWKLQRSISHRQYHTVLKIAHAGMAKFKTVMGAMHSAIDGQKPSTEQVKKLQSMDVPEVVLLQRFEELSRWAKDALGQLHDVKKLRERDSGHQAKDLLRNNTRSQAPEEEELPEHEVNSSNVLGQSTVEMYHERDCNGKGTKFSSGANAFRKDFQPFIHHLPSVKVCGMGIFFYFDTPDMQELATLGHVTRCGKYVPRTEESCECANLAEEASKLVESFSLNFC